VAGGHAKKHINNANESLLREFIAWSGPANPKTLLDMEWAVRKYLFWLETQGVDDALDVNAHSFSGFMTLASRKYAEGSLHDLQLFLKKFHQFLNTEKGLDIPYEFVLSLPVIRKKRVFPPLTKDEIQRTVAQVDRSKV
jgi:site-specific recombinase XerD